MVGVEGLILLIFYLLAVVAILILANYIFGLMKFSEPARQVAMIILGLIILLWFVKNFGLL